LTDVVLLSGDARRIPLADESVQCIVTSPPYWGLRKYAGEQELIWGDRPGICFSAGDGPHPEHEWTEETRAGISGGTNQNCKEEVNADGATNRPLEPSTHGFCQRCGAWRGAYGLEPTVEMYVQHSLEVLRELRRVLRKDGVLFWNLGDSYQSGNRGTYMRPRCINKKSLQAGFDQEDDVMRAPNRMPQDGLKPKDLVLMPARVALAAQADGWWVRSVIVWAKPNPMPESVTDRPTDSYEQILMLTKSARYFWDAESVREPVTGNTHSRGNGDGGPKAREREEEGNHVGWAESTRAVIGYRTGHDARDGKERFCSGTGGYVPPGGRNLRNVWEFATQPYSGAHFATFPEELPRRCILAATSARGSCAQCGAPWTRVTERDQRGAPVDYDGKWSEEDANASGRRMLANLRASRQAGLGDLFGEVRTIGWTPTCVCCGQRGKTVPCVVLDTFAGSGTTGRVAIELGRRAVLVDLAYGNVTDEDRAKGRDYAALARRRTSEVQLTFPTL
jgi:DNA modification methylase